MNFDKNNEKITLSQQVKALTGEDASYMSLPMQAIFKAHLEKERDSLMLAQDSALQLMRGEDEERPVDQLDAAQKQEDLEREQTRAAQRKANLKKVNAALNLLNFEDYGFCVVCGNEIGIERLIAQPMSVMDIHCANKHEKSGRIHTAGHVGLLALN